MPELCPVSLLSLRHARDAILLQSKDRATPLLIGIGGPGGSGKSTVTRWLRDQLEECQVLELDHFRHSREARRHSRRFGSHPLGNDVDNVTSALSLARSGQPVLQPVFDRESGRVEREIELPPAGVYLIDGEIAAHTYLRPHFDLFLLVTTPLAQQFFARMTRDRRDRACSLKKCLHLFWQSNVLDYPRFAARASREAHVHLRRQPRHRFVVVKPT